MRAHAVFDLDGTLVDSVPMFVLILNSMLDDRRADFRITEAQARPHSVAGGHALVSALLGRYCGDVDEAVAEFRARYRSLPTPQDSIYPHVRTALDDLRAAGMELAVWSNKPQGLCEKVLGDLDIARFFSAIVGSGPEVPLKPDPKGFDLALARAGGRRERSCLIGDGEPDYQAARLAGVPFIMIGHGYGDYSRPWPGATVADDFLAVSAIVKRWFAPSAHGTGAEV